MKTVAPPISFTGVSFTGVQLNDARHVCAFFNSDDEKYRVLLPFIKDGFKCGDKAVTSLTQINVTTICNGVRGLDATRMLAGSAS